MFSNSISKRICNSVKGSKEKLDLLNKRLAFSKCGFLNAPPLGLGIENDTTMRFIRDYCLGVLYINLLPVGYPRAKVYVPTTDPGIKVFGGRALRLL